METYEYYLLGTFVLGLVQLRHHVALYRFVRKSPARWPQLYQIVRDHLRLLITWPTVLTVGLMSLLWVAHTAFRRLLYPSAQVSFETLRAEPWLLVAAVLFGAIMFALDLGALVRASSFRPPQRTWLLDLTEAALKAEVLPVRWFVAWRVRQGVLGSLPVVQHWVWKRSAEIGARLAFGTTLWLAWALAA